MQAAFDLAAKKIGLTETGQKAALSEYMANGGARLDPAVTAWCAAFVNASLEQSGIEGTGKLNARSFMEWGQGVDNPQQGDLAVFTRGDPNGWQGHVGFFDGYNEDGTIRVLGGNQGNAVSIANYSPDRLLGFRRADGQQAQAAPQNALAPPQGPTPQEMFVNALQAMPQPRVNTLDPAAFIMPTSRG